MKDKTIFSKGFEYFCDSIIFDHPALDIYENGVVGLTHSNCKNIMQIAYLKALMDYSIWSDNVPGGDEKYEAVRAKFEKLTADYEL